ncbi:MAG: DUF72 domain-containing protein [Planctomycetes bacterium]|nr:DUF72 domain-containing protein [Planctomycetota bacterium]
MELHIGTSGYSYREWKGSFYPEDLSNKDMLSYYGERLGAVEINATFYRLPKTSVLESWAEQVPDGFRFSIKASRKITHFARLKAASQEATEYLLSTLGALGDRLGVDPGGKAQRGGQDLRSSPTASDDLHAGAAIPQSVVLRRVGYGLQHFSHSIHAGNEMAMGQERHQHFARQGHPLQPPVGDALQGTGLDLLAQDRGFPG